MKMKNLDSSLQENYISSQKRYERLLLLFIIVSLLFHLALVIIGKLLPDYLPPFLRAQKIELPKPDKHQQTVNNLSLAGMKSNAPQGARVIFQDEPEDQPAPTSTEKSSQPQRQEEQNIKQEQPLLLTKPVSFVPPSVAPAKKEIAPESDKKITQESKPREKPQQKKKLTFADLASDVLKNIRNEVDANVILGGENRTPTEKDIMFSRYAEKIYKCFDRVLYSKHNHHPLRAPEKNMVITYTINKQGRLTEINVSRSSGATETDAFYVHAFQEASSGFPPLPEAFNMTELTRSCCIAFR